MWKHSGKVLFSITVGRCCGGKGIMMRLRKRSSLRSTHGKGKSCCRCRCRNAMQIAKDMCRSGRCNSIWESTGASCLGARKIFNVIAILLRIARIMTPRHISAGVSASSVVYQFVKIVGRNSGSMIVNFLGKQVVLSP